MIFPTRKEGAVLYLYVEKVISCLPLIHQLMFCLIKMLLITLINPIEMDFVLPVFLSVTSVYIFQCLLMWKTNENVGVKERIKCFYHLKKC